MNSKFKTITKRFVWLFPLIIVTIGIFYFINLFERLYTRDLNRQISEKNQLLTLTESLSNTIDVKNSILTLDTFDNTYTYMLHDEGEDSLAPDSKSEIYHSASCPFLLQKHPHDEEEIRKTIINHKRGSFATKEHGNKIVWEFRHFQVNNEKLLVITGVTNYPKEPIDKELEIAIGTMLLITALLNWTLVGFWKYKCCGSCKIEKKENK